MLLVKVLGWMSFALMSIMALGLAVEGLVVASAIVFLSSVAVVPGVVDRGLRGRVAKLTTSRQVMVLVSSWLVTIFVFAVAVPDEPAEATGAEDVSSSVEIEPPKSQVTTQDQPGTKLDLVYAEAVRVRALVLWRELEAARDSPSFHKFGLGAGGSMHSWHQRRGDLYREWNDYTGTLPLRERVLVGLGSPIAFMYSVALDWARTAGVGTQSTDIMIAEIEVVIVEGDLFWAAREAGLELD